MKQIILAFFLLVILTGILFAVNNRLQTPKNSTLEINGHKFSVLLAITQAEKEKGLGYRDSLPQNEGMLFFFDYPDYQKFWMKGMRFPLDIIYIRNGKIVTIFQNLPNPPPKTTTWEIYSPTQPADKVLEINAGLSQKYNFKIGDSVKTSL